MNLATRFLVIVCLCPHFASANAEIEQPCSKGSGVVLQVLGSGGPIADDGRASSGYLLWIDGVARVLVDVGAGSLLRFGEAGARFEDLDFVGLSHFHTDHSADFPALLKSGSFSGRERPLHVAGPAGGGQFPGLKAWLRSMLDADAGAYGYLSGFLDGTRGQPMLVAREVALTASPALVYRNDAVRIEAMPVPHGVVPAVAFKVVTGDETLVFASDQNASNREFVDFAKGASVLVMHLVVPETVTGVASRLHARPSVIGDVAAKTKAKQLVLSHFMARSLRDIDKNVALVRQGYGGKVILAEDLVCVAAGG